MRSQQTECGPNSRSHQVVILFSFLALALASAQPSKADWINLTGAQNAPNIAEIHVEQDRVRLALEIYVKDIATFVGLVPDEFLRNQGLTAPPLAERIRRFSSEDFQFITQDGRKLQAELKLFEPRLRKDRPFPFAGALNPITRRPVPGPPDDKRVFYAELEYPFKSKPSRLTIVPPLDRRGVPAVSIGFVAYHENVPIVDYRFLPSSAELHLDWADPWYSYFKNKALKRWQQSGLMMYLYVEPYEVRHEVLVRVKDMANLMDLGLRGSQFIEVDELNPLKKRIGEFFLKHSNALIDGKRLKPILDRTSFVKYTMTRTFFLEQAERMRINTAMLGIIVTYLTDGIPQEVKVEWDVFSDRIQKVPTSAVDPAGPFPSFVTPDDNVLLWKNVLKTYKMPTVTELKVEDSLLKVNLPVASMLCLIILVPILVQIRKRSKEGRPIRTYIVMAALVAVAGGLLYPVKVAVARPAAIIPKMSDQQAVTILNSLLKNVYRSFDFREEEAVYDRLATSVTGDLLTDIYLQNRRSLVVTQAGGARARVKKVKIQDVRVKHLDDRPLALLLHSKWTALGEVGHWGHIHTRMNQYEANITVEPVDGSWKITGLELLEEKRIDPYGKPKTTGKATGS